MLIAIQIHGAIPRPKHRHYSYSAGAEIPDHEIIAVINAVQSSVVSICPPSSHCIAHGARVGIWVTSIGVLVIKKISDLRNLVTWKIIDKRIIAHGTDV